MAQPINRSVKTTTQPIDNPEVNTPVIKKTLSYEQLRARDNEMVRGRFKYEEVPGGTLVFSYKKFKNDPVRNFTLEDGKIYTIPRGVAKHLATSGSYPIHEYQTDENGRPIVRIGRHKRRYTFESLGFFDDIEETQQSSLYTVEKIL